MAADGLVNGSLRWVNHRTRPCGRSQSMSRVLAVAVCREKDGSLLSRGHRGGCGAARRRLPRERAEAAVGVAHPRRVEAELRRPEGREPGDHRRSVPPDVRRRGAGEGVVQPRRDRRGDLSHRAARRAEDRGEGQALVREGRRRRRRGDAPGRGRTREGVFAGRVGVGLLPVVLGLLRLRLDARRRGAGERHAVRR